MREVSTNNFGLRPLSTEWREPEVFDPASSIDQTKVRRHIEAARIDYIHDRAGDIADELFAMRFPEQAEDMGAQAAFRQEYIGENQGKLVYFDWLRALVRYPDMVDHQELRTYRNRELITREEQIRLLGKRAVVFGLSVGSNVLEQLVRSGVGGAFAFGDPDDLTPTNLNRVNASMIDVGVSKLVIAARKTSLIDPYLTQQHYLDGATNESLAQLRNFAPDVIFDEVDDLAIKAKLRLFARETATPLVMVTDLADKAIVDVERYDIDVSTKPFGGRLSGDTFRALLEGRPMNEKEKRRLMIKMVGVHNLTPRMIASATKIGHEIGGLPQLGTTSALGGSAGTLVAREILLGRRMRSGRYVNYDLHMQPAMKPMETVATIATFLRTKK